MVVGSRLGAAAVVVFIGAFDYLNGEPDTVREATSPGLLTTGFVISVVLLLVFGSYCALIDGIQTELLASRTYFVGFLVSLSMLPLGIGLL